MAILGCIFYLVTALLEQKSILSVTQESQLLLQNIYPMYKYLYVTIIIRFVFLESSSKYDRCKRVISEIPKNKVTGYLSPVVHELISYAKSVQCVDKYSSLMLNLLYQHFRGADDCSVANNVLQ